MTEITKWLPLFGYFLLFVGVVVVVLKRVAAGAGKFHLQDDVILLRKAGEGLDQKHRELMEKLPEMLGQALALPLVMLCLPLLLIRWSSGIWQWGLLFASASLFLAALVWGVGKVRALAMETRNVRLGLFGERAVADELDKLTWSGYRIFHDVPCLGATGPFNLDHVVVGKGGVAVIETKTYRKPKGGEAKANCRVEYDGQQLIWPNYRSTKELEQVGRNAEWLRKYLKKELLVETTAMQVLAIPGWYVVQPKGGDRMCRVMNQKQLAKGINDLNGSMSPKEEELVIKRLTSLCTDVKYEMVA